MFLLINSIPLKNPFGYANLRLTGPRGEMDITTGFGPVIGGSNPSEGKLNIQNVTSHWGGSHPVTPTGHHSQGGG